jgi:bifunctional non-homologous end joining protein LigD
MLAKPGPLPTRGGWAFEPKWDGFRAIIRSGDEYCVRSRRGWQLTELLPEFSALPIEGVFGGELVAFGYDGLPSFDRLSRRILHGDTTIPVVLVLFDVLEVEGLSTMQQPYRERREILELFMFNLTAGKRRIAGRFDSCLAHFGPHALLLRKSWQYVLAPERLLGSESRRLLCPQP